MAGETNRLGTFADLLGESFVNIESLGRPRPRPACLAGEQV
jgi:hypothetical protein